MTSQTKDKPMSSFSDIASAFANIDSSASKPDEYYASLAPAIRCPNCDQTVTGLHDSRETLPPPKPTKFNQLPVNGVTSQQAGPAVMTWRVFPCGCQVSTEWASALGKEMHNRRQGGTPQAVVVQASVLAAKKQELEADIAKLMAKKTAYEDQYIERSIAGMPPPPPGELLSLERKLIVLVDQLQKLCPGAHNKLPKTSYSQEALAWAAQNKLVIGNATASASVLEKIAEFLAIPSTKPAKPSSLAKPSSPAKPSPPAKIPTANPIAHIKPQSLPLPGAKDAGYVDPAAMMELEILLPPYVPLPQIGEGVQDQNGNFLGYCSGVVTSTSPTPHNKIRILQGSKGSMTPDEVKAVSAWQEQNSQANLKDMALKIKQSLDAHQARGTPLIPEAKAYLEHFQHLAKEVPQPEILTHEQRTSRFAESYGVGQRQRISRARRPKKS